MRNVWLFLCCFLICLSFDSEAQFNRKQIKKNNKRIASYRGRKQHFGREKIYNAVSISLNATNYYGDLAPKPNKFSTDISFTRPGIGISLNHRFGPRYTLMGQFMVTTLRGSDKESADPNDDSGGSRYLRNMEFRNTIKEFSAVAIFDLFENQATYISRVRWTPYAFLGVAGFISNPKARAPETDLNGNPLAEAGKWVKLRPLGTEGQHADLLETDANFGKKPYKAFQFAIPFGFGARFRINQVLDVWGDIGFRYTFTDYLDDVSGNYVDLGVFGNDELARAMSYRTNELNPGGLTPELARNGQTYQLRPGYGKEHPNNIRGSDNDKDIYMVTSIRLSYIIGATYHKARFR